MSRSIYLTSIVAAVLLTIMLICEFTPLGYDRVEFDLTTGRTRYLYRFCGVPYRSTAPDRGIADTPWLARDLKPGETAIWGLLRYLDNYGAPRIRSRTGVLANEVRSVGQQLEMHETERSGRDLLAEFIRPRMKSMIGGYPNSDRDWAEMQYIFDRLDSYDETLPLRTREDVESLIDEAVRNASS